jgi:hypothetical protein
MRPGVDLAGDVWAINAVRILIVLGLADISLRYIEIPIRRGEFSLWWRGLKYRTPNVRKRGRLTVLISFAVTVVVLATSSSVAIYRHNHAKQLISQADANNAATVPIIQEKKEGLWVTGDSVILGIRAKLASHFSIALINARVGRQIQELTDVVRQDKPHVAGDTVVLDLGNNNRLTRDSVETLFALLKDQPHIVVVNTAVPRGWRDENNKIIASVAGEYPQAKIVDWASISSNHPEFFAPDGVHLNDTGSDVYVAAILEYLK